VRFAQIVQPHALSCFYLSAPDFLLGMDSDPASRNVLGVIAGHPELAHEFAQFFRTWRDAFSPAAKAIADRAIHFFKGALDNYKKEEIKFFRSFPTGQRTEHIIDGTKLNEGMLNRVSGTRI
jgi:hypothetical protein